MTDALALTLKDALATLAALEAIPCDSPENAALLNEVFVSAYAQANALEEARKKETSAHDAAIKAARERYRPAIDALRAVENAVRVKAEEAALAGIARKEASLDAAVAAARTGEALALSEGEDSSPQALPGGLSVSFAWSYELTGEPVEEEFLSPDSGKIRDFLSGFKNSSHVPPRAGLRWKRTAVTKARAGVGK